MTQLMKCLIGEALSPCQRGQKNPFWLTLQPCRLNHLPSLRRDVMAEMVLLMPLAFPGLTLFSDNLLSCFLCTLPERHLAVFCPWIQCDHCTSGDRVQISPEMRQLPYSSVTLFCPGCQLRAQCFLIRPFKLSYVYYRVPQTHQMSIEDHCWSHVNSLCTVSWMNLSLSDIIQ